MNFWQDLRRFFSTCCLRSNQIDHRMFNDPSTFYINLAINALTIRHSKHWIIADFGSSYGQHSIEMMKVILQCLRQQHQFYQTPLIIHLDLPTNNWTTFFQKLTLDNTYHSLAMGRSFYEQCLPTNSISIGFSQASLHYLSKKPCNILHHCYIHFAQAHEREQFRRQSKLDFETFLEYRARELRSGGILILSIPSINEKTEMGFNRYFHLIYQCAQVFLAEEHLEEFTLPFYLRSLSECIDLDLFKRCALKLIRGQLVRIKPLIFYQYHQQQITREQLIQSLITLMHSSIDMTLKATLERHQYSSEEIERISTGIWLLFEEKLQMEIMHDHVHIYTTYLILKKK